MMAFWWIPYSTAVNLLHSPYISSHPHRAPDYEPVTVKESMCLEEGRNGNVGDPCQFNYQRKVVFDWTH